jgi:hypothetical protein
MMKKLFLVLLVMAAVLAIAPAALADSFFPYTFNGSGLDTSLTFTGHSNGDGSYTITNVAGTIFNAGSDITSPVAIDEAPVTDNSGNAPDNIGVTFFDNQLFPTTTPAHQTALDYYGVLFEVNGLYINIFGVIGGDNGTTPGYEWSDSGSYTNNSSSTRPLTTTATPEPSALLLFGTGLLGLAFVAFRKAKSSGLVLHS